MMRGKLRDKRDVKRDRLKREMTGRKSTKKDHRNRQFVQFQDDDYLLDNDDESKVPEEKNN
jgi:hypothetical protein